MLSFREYVSAVGSSIRTVASRKFRETYEQVLAESKIVMLDKTGKYVLNRWHSPRLNIITEGDVQGEWIDDQPPLDSTAWIGFRPSIKENVPNGEIAVRFGTGIPLNYNKNKYIIADEYRITHVKELRSDLNLAWPTAELAVMGPQGAVEIVHRRELQEATNAEVRRAELVEEYMEKKLCI